ncbi:hypothetical protein [Enterococcus cecorum]|uniref:hypothetical protein n=1 Tax=Enterococcus cecorum TaxID=44008 RepID=UPI00200ADAA8|nr:hypothetical protein [Enterococcus cecorum]
MSLFLVLSAVILLVGFQDKLLIMLRGKVSKTSYIERVFDEPIKKHRFFWGLMALRTMLLIFNFVPKNECYLAFRGTEFFFWEFLIFFFLGVGSCKLIAIYISKLP